MTLHIGIVACSAEGAALCYKTICKEANDILGSHCHPEISMHTPPLSKYVECLDNDDWLGVGNLMLVSAEKLVAMGADFLICPDNTIHKGLDMVMANSPAPWIHIAQVVSEEAQRRNFKKIGLMGTKWLVESETYPQKLSDVGINCYRPDDYIRAEVGRIIMEELVKGEFLEPSVSYLQDVISGFVKAKCDAVVLGCTELPLVLNDSNSALPTLDSTRLLARAALKQAL